MGEANRKKNRSTRLLEEHRWCCFCGGDQPSVSIDHIPARTCFVGRQYPEGFEFPACGFCQDASRLDEIAFSFYVRALDGRDMNSGTVDKMVRGLANNLPHLLPNPYLSSRQKRSTLARMGLSKPSGVLASELPVIQINTELHERIDRYARKIACAIFYKEKARIASPDHVILATWGQFQDRKFIDGARDFIEMTPLIRVGMRTNIDIGDQFIYRANWANDPDVMAAIIFFGRGIVLQILMVDEQSAKVLDSMAPPELKDVAASKWTRVGDNYKLDSENKPKG